MSKGSKSKITNKKRFDENYDAIFRAQKAMELGYKIAPFNGRRRREDIVPPTPILATTPTRKG